MGDLQGNKDTLNLFLKAVNGVVKHPSLQFCLQDAEQMKKFHSQTESSESAVMIVKLMSHLKFITVKNINHLESMFHAVVTSEVVFGDFKALLEMYGIILLREHIVFWVLMDHLRGEMIQTLRQLEKPDTSLEQTQLDESELMTLRYVAGFILRKQLRRCDPDVTDFLENFLENLETVEDDDDTEQDDFLGYTKALVEGRDRGGLIKVNDDFFILFVTIEKVCKAIFTRTSSKPNKDTIIKEIKGTDNMATWDKMSGYNHYELFDKIIDNYAILRMKAYAEGINFLKMKRSRINKSLRKTLD